MYKGQSTNSDTQYSCDIKLSRGVGECQQENLKSLKSPWGIITKPILRNAGLEGEQPDDHTPSPLPAFFVL